MAVQSGVWHSLMCEGTQHDEVVALIDPDSEITILNQDVDELRAWAHSNGWIWYDGTDRCGECRVSLMEVPHLFVADVDVPSICVICHEWATEGQHTAEIPGQLELPTT